MKSNDDLLDLESPAFRSLKKIVQDNESMHNVALKEIAYNMILLKSLSEISTKILMQIYVKYRVDRPLMESILTMHSSCGSAMIQDKIQEALKALQLQRQAVDSRLAQGLVGCFDYLELADCIKIGLLNKQVHYLTQTALKQRFLKDGSLELKARTLIYRSVIPERLRVQSCYASTACCRPSVAS